MNWISLSSIEQLIEINKLSENENVLIFKHSTRCSISSMAMNRLERDWDENKTTIKTYYLDLIAHRDISHQIAADYQITHQSPQVILIRNGKSVYNASHNSIIFSEIAAALE